MLKLKLIVLFVVVVFGISFVGKATGSLFPGVGSNDGGIIEKSKSKMDKNFIIENKNALSDRTNETSVTDARNDVRDALERAREDLASSEGPTNLGTYFKLPADIISQAQEFVTSESDEIPTVDHRTLITNNPVTEEQLQELEQAGYKIEGALGNFVNFTAPLDIIVSEDTGPQTFDWIQQVAGGTAF